MIGSVWRKTLYVAAASGVVLLSGCTTLTRQNAVPQALYGQETIEGMPGIRYPFFSQQGIDVKKIRPQNRCQIRLGSGI